MRYLFLTVLSSLLVSASLAQNLYIPRDIRKSYENNTRSADGKPGKKYWQNRGEYTISIALNPPDRKVQGSEEVTYYNNSPDTLKTIVFKLIPNIHRPGVIRYNNVENDYLTEGLTITSLLINGKKFNWTNTMGTTTVQEISLPSALLPSGSVKLNIEWTYPLSLISNREGVIYPNTFFLAYFYPRIAVYDDYTGWDHSHFTDQEEFYNDFNDYTLKIKAPQDYLVWSTGTLQNGADVLQPKYYSRFNSSLTSDSVIHIVNNKDLQEGNITKGNSANTWIWKATNVTDVAFGISKQYLWDGGSVVVDSKSGRRASMQAAYPETAKDFRNAVSWGQYALKWYSSNWPGVPYPYPAMTAFQGFADMEYPMIVNDSPFADWEVARFVLDHEIVHSYFPFYMGINENRFSFMDEGWATAFELLIAQSEIGVEKAEETFRRRRVIPWSKTPSVSSDLPIITPTYEQRGLSFRTNSYGKPALAYLALKDLLGDELFKKCLHQYMHDWNGKHPVAWDFFYSFNHTSGVDLDWFWNNWFFSNNFIDLSAEKLEDKGKNRYALTILNKGGLPIPFKVQITFADGQSRFSSYGPKVWKGGAQHISVPLEIHEKIKSVSVLTGVFADADDRDNTI